MVSGLVAVVVARMLDGAGGSVSGCLHGCARGDQQQYTGALKQKSASERLCSAVHACMGDAPDGEQGGRQAAAAAATQRMDLVHAWLAGAGRPASKTYGTAAEERVGRRGRDAGEGVLRPPLIRLHLAAPAWKKKAPAKRKRKKRREGERERKNGHVGAGSTCFFR